MKYIRNVYKLCNILALTPPHKLGASPTSLSPIFKCYTLFIIFAISAIYIYSAIGREQYIYGGLEGTVVVTDRFAHFAIAFVNVLFRIMIIFVNGENLKVFLNSAYELFQQQQHEFRCISSRQFKLQLFIFHFYIGLVIAYDAYLWVTTVGIRYFQYYMGRSTFYYVFNLMLFFIFHSALILEYLFLHLNRYLNKVLSHLVQGNIDKMMNKCLVKDFKITNFSERDEFGFKDLRKIRKAYNNICQLTYLFTKIYGFIILVSMIVIVLFILNVIDLFLVYAVNSGKNLLSGQTYGPDLIASCNLWIVTFIVLTVLLVQSCDGAMKESENIATITFIWLNEMPAISQTKKQEILKEELNLLIQQVTSQRPNFSAAGFFRIDFGLLSFILQSVTTYIIVLIQIIKI